MIWFFHSNGTETSFSRTSRATANSAPVNIGAAATKKHRAIAVSASPTQTKGRRAHDHAPCCGDVRARHCQLQVNGSARTARAPASERRMRIVDVKRFYHQINTSGRNERAKPGQDGDWTIPAFGEASSVTAAFAHAPAERQPTVAAARITDIR